MATYEVLNQLELSDGEWGYQARLLHEGVVVDVSGAVADYGTSAQIKTAICDDVERHVSAHLESIETAETKTVNIDGVFKDAFTI